MSEDKRWSVEVATAEEGWVTKWRCKTLIEALSKFEDCAGDGQLVRIMQGSKFVKAGGGPQGYSPHPGKGAVTMSTEDSQPVDFSKPVQTRNGFKARIYTTEGSRPERPVIGEYRNSRGIWIIFRRRPDGKAWIESDDDLDLVNVPQEHTLTGNVYRPGGGTLHICLFDSRDKADKSATYDRIACIPVTFVEGEGLE